MRWICPHCGSADIRTELAPGTVHYAKLMCAGCGRWLRWLPRPIRTIAPELIRALSPGALPLDAPLPELWGTPAQVAFAASVRPDLLSRLCPELDRDLFRLMRGITDASWWLSNRSRRPDEIRWPEAWFAANPVAEGGRKPSDTTVLECGCTVRTGWRCPVHGCP